MKEFDEYQDFTDTTDVYPNDKFNIGYKALGLVGEAGEVADKVKKHLRDGKALDIGGIIYELGDVCWYVARMAEALGYELEDVLTINYSKLESRKSRDVLTGSGDER